jgi:uncharacterized protein
VPGSLVHIAFNADDDGPTVAFYEAVFGWTFGAEEWPGFRRASIPSGPEAIAAIQSRRELVAGVRQTGPEVTIAVDDLDEVLAAATAAGGEIVMARADIPGVGALAFVADPSRNVVGVIEFKPSTSA